MPTCSIRWIAMCPMVGSPGCSLGGAIARPIDRPSGSIHGDDYDFNYEGD
jgi:hypothetical protein